MKLCLIDGYGFVFRAFHSMPPLNRPDGTPINAVYGFTNMLLKFIASHEADYIAVMLDSGKKTFRHNLFDAYKANRPSPPEELIVQFPIIREVIEALNLVAIETDGFEADDLIASYAKAAELENMEVKIVSSDKDLMQLITDKTKLFDAMKNKTISFEEVKEKFGVAPSKVLDILSLIGDSSDNIPGVKGIGPKTAAELINKFDSLENLYNNLDKVENLRQRNLLNTDRDNALMSQKLVSLKDDLELKFSWDDLKVKELDKNKLAEFLKIQGFKSLAAKFQSVVSPVSITHEKKKEAIYKKIQNPNKLSALHDTFFNESIISLIINDNKLEISSANHNFELDLNTNVQQDLFSSSQDSIHETLNCLKPILEDVSVTKVLHEAKKLLKFLSSHSIDINSYEDIGIMAYLLNSNNQELSLEKLCEITFGESAQANSASLLQLYWIFKGDLIKDGNFSLYEKMEKPLISTLATMEMKGVKIDEKVLNSLSSDFIKKIKACEEKIWSIAGAEFNIGSPKQLGEVLFNQLKIPYPKKSKSGSFSTGVEILDILSEQGFEIADQILAWRHYSKLMNTYTESLPKSINPKTGRVHTTFQMTATSTGRLSSINPNLQNIPIRSEEGQKIRSAFVASPGHAIISADYSQIELRLLAHMADVQQLKNAFKNGQDIHSVTAMEILNLTAEQLTPELRRQAKAINFGIIYGISAFGLAKQLLISREAAQKYIANYFLKYPGIKQYMNKTIEYARQHGFVKTLYNRKCVLNGINDRSLKSFAERAAINAPLQGTQADIIKKAMLKLPQEIINCMMLQIHDELLFEVPLELVESYMEIIKSTMENVVQISVPLIVDVKAAQDWSKAH